MKWLVIILLFIFPILSFGQSICSNTIDGVNPNNYNPYTNGQIVDANISATGIGRGSTIFGLNANDRYDAKSWGLATFDSDSYFEFTLTPNVNNEIDLISFEYTGLISNYGPTLFAFRSSVDGFTSNIGNVNGIGGTISLLATAYQNITSSITFRFYGWNASAGTGSFSINDFNFKGIVSCLQPQVPVLPEISLSCTATSFDLNWVATMFDANYFIDVATDPDFSNYLTGYENKALGNILSETISGLYAGTNYYVRMRSANSCGVSANSNEIKVGPPVTVYDGKWSNGIPDISKNVQFLKDFHVQSLLEACSCQIDNNVALNVDYDAIVKLQNGLQIFGNGTLTFENNSSLVQVNDAAVNIGKINYKRQTSAVENFDYVYWCSPVTDQKLNHFSPNSDKYYSYSSGGWIPEKSTNTMSPEGKGFIIRVPKLDTNGSQKFEFVGVPNNGFVQVDVDGVKYNLIGNPYPCAIDADTFILNSHNKAMINSALYFWTHNTKRTLIGSQYVYTSNDYATYNLTGGTGIGLPTGTALSGETIPSGNIAAGQAFFVSSPVGQLYFDNSMRISTTLANSQFFKQPITKKIAKIEKNRVWLNLTNDNGAFKQLLVGYITGATNEIDNLYDGLSINGNSFIDFYSVNNAKNYTIQGRALPFVSTDQVALGYSSTIAGKFKISIDTVDGSMVDQTIYIEDKMTNTIHDLKSGTYSFTTEIGTFNDRFVLRYTDTSKLVTDDNQIKWKGVVVSVKNRQIKINSFDQNITAVKVYDLKGSLIYEKDKLNNGEFIIDNLTSSNQSMIVMIKLENGKWVSEKIIF